MEQIRVWNKGEKNWEASFLSVYPITMTIGFILAFLTVAYFWKKQKYPWEHLQILLIVIVPTSLFGARTWFLLFPPAGVHADWSKFFRFEGLAIQGGVMASASSASLYLYTVRHTVDYRTAFGIILPAVIIGQAMGRWGNFANHEVFGAVVGHSISTSNAIPQGTYHGETTYKITKAAADQLGASSLNWLSFIKPHMLIQQGGKIAYRQPFFFYESMLNFLGYFIMVWVLLRRNFVKPGTTGGIYFFWYGFVRMIMEPLRDVSDIMKSGGTNLSELISLLWILFGLIIIIWFQGLTKPYDKWFKKIFTGMAVLTIWIKNPTFKKQEKNKEYENKIQNSIFLKWFKWLDSKQHKEYEAIMPIKPRRIFFFGEKVEYKKKYFIFFGPKVDNRVKLWIPKEDEAWTKREINRGKRLNKK